MTEKRSKQKPTQEEGAAKPSALAKGFWELIEAWPFPEAAEIEQRFEELIRRRWVRAYEPPADVFVVDEEIWVEMDLPGIEEEEIRARIERGMLLIEATRRIRRPAGVARAASLERPHGPVRRRVPLPGVVRSARLEIKLEGGVLRVRVLPEEKE